MRILRVHNRYQQRGGEDVNFETESALLQAAGHDVTMLEFDNASIPEQPTPRARLTLAATTVWSRGARTRIIETIARDRPEVAHFDNTFPLVSPSAYGACCERGVAVVQSLHNYRLICPSANLYRDDRPCEDCVGSTPWPGVAHACYRDSRAQTAVVAAMLSAHRIRRTWSREVDRYIALTEFVKAKHVEGGLPAERIVVKPNFVDLPPPTACSARSGVLFVGRLTPEKGINSLLEVWSSDPGMTLTIVGDGPLHDEVARFAHDHEAVTFLGRLPEREAWRLMARARAVIVPSTWPEPFGRVAIEAFACGTPVIAPAIGGLTEVVEHGRTGIVHAPGDAAALGAAVRWARDHPAELREMGVHARREYEARFTPQCNKDILMDVYGQAIVHARRA